MTDKPATENDGSSRSAGNPCPLSPDAWEDIFHCIDEALVVADRQGNILCMNPAALALHDLSSQQAHQGIDRFATLFEVTTLDDEVIPVTEWPLARVASGERVPRLEIKVHNRLTGRHWIASYVGTPVFDAAGRFTFAVATIRDETARHAAASELAENQERLFAALAASETGTFRWDIRTNVLEGDDNLCRLFGIPEDKKIARLEDFVALVHPDDRDKTIFHIARSMRDGADFDLEFRIQRPNGDVQWLLDRGRVVRDNRGRPAYMTGACHIVTGRKQAEAQQRLLMAELDHRVKNVLAVVKSLVTQTARNYPSVDAFVQAIQGRIGALSRSHSLLSRSSWTGADLHALVMGELTAFSHDAANLTVEGDPVVLRNKAAQSFSIVLHELATNAAKYGAFSQPGGHVDITWTLEKGAGEPRLVLRWQERGGPAVTPPARRGFGCMLISRGTAYELGGEAELDFRPEGLVCTITAPLAQVAQE